MRIGQLATLADVRPATLRYYERRGMLPRPARTGSGYRTYSPEAVIQLRLIRWAKSVGFSLREIRETFGLVGDHIEGRGDQVRAKVKAKIREIDARMVQLAHMRESLAALAACRCRRSCPIVARALAEPSPTTRR